MGSPADCCTLPTHQSVPAYAKHKYVPDHTLTWMMMAGRGVLPFLMCADLHSSKPAVASVLLFPGRAGSQRICSPLRLPVKVNEEQHLSLCVPWQSFKDLQHSIHALVVALASRQP